MRDTHEEKEKFRKITISKGQIKQLFPAVVEQDLDVIAGLANDKLRDLQKKISVHDISSLVQPTLKESLEELSDYLNELKIEYDTTGLEVKYKKIQKVLDIIVDVGYTDDLKIIEEIKKEYVETKILNKSSMLYLNKIYKQLIEENDNGKTSTPPPDDGPRRRGGLSA